MGRSTSKGRGSQSRTSRGLMGRKWMLLRVIVVAVIVSVIALFRDIVFEHIGLSIILWLLWTAVLLFIIFGRRLRTLFTWWNVWLGALSITVAIWGILSLYHPAGLVIGETDFASVSLGGDTGKYLIGNQGVGVVPSLRITLLVLAAIILIAPGLCFRFLRFAVLLVKTSVILLVTYISRIVAYTGRKLSGFYHQYRPHKWLAIPFINLNKALQRRKTAGTEKAKNIRLPAIDHGEAVAGAQPTSIGPTITEESPQIQPDTVLKDKGDLTAVPNEKDPKSAAAVKGMLPDIELLEDISEVPFAPSDNEQRARLIEESLASYGVDAKVVQINPGPSVTQFGIEPGWDRKYKRVAERDQQGKVKLDKDGKPIHTKEEISKTRVKVERITALANNLALALASPSIRIEAPVPGKSLVGIEVPNDTTSVVRIRSVIDSPAFKKVRLRSSITLALGKGAAGEPVAADLAKMPHLLIAGETGSGKTVCINSIITCLLTQNTPQDMRMLLIDPKRVELVSFANIPHLIHPVVTEVEKATDALRRAIKEMDHRYREFATVGVRNIEGYNRSPLVSEPMPYLVVIIDELAHLMMTAAEIVEPSVCRLAQLSRATGIHLIIATQRPSVDVVTGLIKANFPTRIAFAVTSIVDSRTILDAGGAEKLLGRGDMLYMPPDAAKPKRLRGCFASDAEIDSIVKFWTQQREPDAAYREDTAAESFVSRALEEAGDEDPMLSSARRLAKESSHISTSLIQRRLHIGYPRAARIMDMLERDGVIVRSEPSGAAEVVINEEEVEEEE